MSKKHPVKATIYMNGAKMGKAEEITLPDLPPFLKPTESKAMLKQKIGRVVRVGAYTPFPRSGGSVEIFDDLDPIKEKVAIPSFDKFRRDLLAKASNKIIGTTGTPHISHTPNKTNSMNKQTFKAMLRGFQRLQIKMIASKGEDYATSNDVLSNFKAAAAASGTTPFKSCLNLIATKVARLGALSNQAKAPNNESIGDSIADLYNYTALLNAINIERQVGVPFADLFIHPGFSEGADMILDEREKQLREVSSVSCDVAVYGQSGRLANLAVYCMTKDEEYWPEGFSEDYKEKIDAIVDPVELCKIAGALCAAEIDIELALREGSEE